MKNYINNFLFAIAIVLISSFGATAQTVTSVVASSDGAQVTITYDYADAGFNTPRYIYLYMTTDGGTTYSHLTGTTGDIDGPMTDGIGKTIIWNILDDYPAGLTGVTSSFEVRGFPFEIVPVAGATFEMGCKTGRDDNSYTCAADESPLHNVTLSDYSIGKYEITNAQYVTFLNATGVASDGSFNDAEHGNREYIDMNDASVMIIHNGTTFEVRDNSANGTDLSDYPVIEVSWWGANAYAKWVDGRLPTEAEWEFAARGGRNSEGYQYSGSNTVADVAWYFFNSSSPGESLFNGRRTHPVGTLAANELGIYDMTGNVEEWCQDKYSSSYYATSPATDPQGLIGGPAHTIRVLRGGHNGSNPVSELRTSDRINRSMDAFFLIGFRVVIP